MSKNKNNPHKKQAVVLPALKPDYKIFAFPNHYVAYAILAIVSFGIYFNSIRNENALDDGIIIQKNEFVLRGKDGIKDIMSRDSYYSFYRQMNAEDQLRGGRYRPLSVVSFALEQEFIGTYPNGVFQKVRDLNNDGIMQREEANNWDDMNGDGLVQDSECHECWDKNKANFYRDTVMIKDPKTGKMRAKFQSDTIPPDKIKTILKDGKGMPFYTEDINQDGNVNDKDCEVEGSGIRHFNNVLSFAILVIVLFRLLSGYVFNNNHDLAFLATLLFAIHPIHTEVVANVKSRDEIFSMIFICLTFIFAFRYAEKKPVHMGLFVLPMVVFFWLVLPAAFGAEKNAFKLPLLAGLATAAMAFITSSGRKKSANSSLIMSGLMFFFALLSKEYAISLVAVVPMTIWLFRRDIKSKELVTLVGVMLGWLFVYIVMRLSSVTLNPGVPDTEILNNPYLLATDTQKLATKIYVLLKYLRLLFWPDPLSSDYSYNTIEYREFSDAEVWLSILVNLSLVAYGTYLFIKRKEASFAFVFYFANLFWVCNLFFDIGATMGERLVFHSSLGVTTGVAWILCAGLPRLMKKDDPASPPARPGIALRAGVIGLTLVACYLGGKKTWERNYDWKNDITLFCKDVETVPNSVLVLGNAGARWIDKSEWPQNAAQRVPYLQKSKGYLTHALHLHPKYVNGYLNLGLAYYKLHEFDVKQNYLDSATYTWKKAESLYPTNPYLKIYFGVLMPRLIDEAKLKGQAGDYKSALRLMRLAYWLDPNNPESNYNLGGAMHSVGKLDSAMYYFNRTLQMNPNHKLARDGLNSITVTTVVPPANTAKP